jgi:enamine deaminase RidA (YjgF/YER057c/UK114 family)
MGSADRLGVEYLSPDELAACRARGWQDVLGIALYSAQATALDAPGVPVVPILMRPLGSQSVVCEVWRANGPLTAGTVGRVRYRTNDAVLFGCIMLPEASLIRGVDDGTALRTVTEQAYAEVFHSLTALGFPRVLRIWNYLPQINADAGGVERYRQFNEARHQAFQSFRREVKGNVPAACALGSAPGSPLVVYFLAGVLDGTAIENPRQVPAYDYPPEYGAFSPTFSRATLADSAAHQALFVSGTASIVGYRTVHVGDVVAQTRETIANIRALVDAANRAAGTDRFTEGRLRYKAYVRRAADLEAVKSELEKTLHPAAPIVYLNADVCRSDLLVEVEAVGFGAPPGAR